MTRNKLLSSKNAKNEISSKYKKCSDDNENQGTQNTEVCKNCINIKNKKFNCKNSNCYFLYKTKDNKNDNKNESFLSKKRALINSNTDKEKEINARELSNLSSNYLNKSNNSYLSLSELNKINGISTRNKFKTLQINISDKNSLSNSLSTLIQSSSKDNIVKDQQFFMILDEKKVSNKYNSFNYINYKLIEETSYSNIYPYISKHYNNLIKYTYSLREHYDNPSIWRKIYKRNILKLTKRKPGIKIKGKKFICKLHDKEVFTTKTMPKVSKSCSPNDDGYHHFPFKVGMKIKDLVVTNLLGNGTFGRVLEVKNNSNKKKYALKVIRPSNKYIDLAESEVNVLKYVEKNDSQNKSNVIRVQNSFTFNKQNIQYFGIVFEKLGKSVFQVLEDNKYIGNFLIKDILWILFRK